MDSMLNIVSIDRLLVNRHQTELAMKNPPVNRRILWRIKRVT
jgi:hypothetical protein